MVDDNSFNNTPGQRRSRRLLNEININLNELEQVQAKTGNATTDGKNLKNRRRIALAVTLLSVLTVASVVPAVVYSLVTNANNDCMAYTLFYF